MNAKFELQELGVIPQNTLVNAFETETGIKAIVENIKAQAREQVTNVVWDLSKKKDRDAIASLARKVASSKTAIDAAGKQLKETYTVITNKIDADRKYARDELDPVRDEIRKPLTDWEQAEKDRVANHENKISNIRYLASMIQNQDRAPSDTIRENIAHLELLVIDSDFEEYEEQAKLAKFESLEILRKALIESEKYEAEQAELERLRIAEQERIKREHEEKIAREAAERATREAEEKARLEVERVQREKLEAEQREARLKAEKEAAILREQQLKIQAEQQAKQAEIDKQQAIEAERVRIEIQRADQQEAERKAEEARKANVEHMRNINREAVRAFIDLGCGLEVVQIETIIKAIHANRIPHVSIKY